MAPPIGNNDGHNHDHNHENCDHDHSSEHEMLEPSALTDALLAARVGLKSQVQLLVDVLDSAQVYIPLAEDLPDAPLNEALPFEGDLTFRPHMILNEDESIFAVAFSEPDFAQEMQSALGWTTSEDELKFICVPAHVAFELCSSVVDCEQVSGLVFNPGTDAELVLLPDESASLAQGTAIPLVGYVADLPADEDGGTEEVEGADPPPQELMAALQAAKERIAELLDVSVMTTFNPERDREPHLTITLKVLSSQNLDRQALADNVMEQAAEFVPAPGYADIVFVDAPN